ncbi:hypothetical protein LX36DRAFT_35432 [Colletotrichum falcatum]|nr:hypothetical protein LX36DRAFT_35432 [Colletotrichum falcatum]
MPLGRPTSLSGATQAKRQTQGSCTFLLPLAPDYGGKRPWHSSRKNQLSVRSAARLHFRHGESDQPECPIHTSPRLIRTFPRPTSFPRLSNRTLVSQPPYPSRHTIAKLSWSPQHTRSHLNFSLSRPAQRKLLFFFSHNLSVSVSYRELTRTKLLHDSSTATTHFSLLSVDQLTADIFFHLDNSQLTTNW